MKYHAVLLLLFLSAALASGESWNERQYREYRRKNDLLENIINQSIARQNSQCLGVNSCCSFSNRCGLGEGDCDSDGECVEGLVCGRCQHEFEVPVFGRWVMEEENFSRTDTCCRLPEEFEREFEF